MAITFDNCTWGGAGVANPTNFNHEIFTEVPNRYLKVTITTRSDLGFGRNIVSGVTYGGDAMTPLVGPITIGDADEWYYYLVNPKSGINQVSVSFAPQFVGCNSSIVAVSYVGVDTTTPHGVHQTATGNALAAISVNLTSEAGELCVDGYGQIGGPAGTPDGDQTRRCAGNFGGGGANAYHSTSEEVGAAAVTMGWTGTAGQDKTLIAVPLKAAVLFHSRPIEYTLDAWDPEQRILDSAGHEVPRYKIKPNNWCRIVGLESTTAIVYDSNYEDPTLVYFESVSYDGETDEVQIITNRGDLPEVIMARLASGSTG